MFSKDIGIDLGTANTLVYMRGKGIIIREPSVVAVDVKMDRVRYVGQEAKDVIGRTPGSIVAVRPLKDGVIADFDMTTSMLQEFIRKALKGRAFAGSRVRVIICIPSGVTAVERRAVKEATQNAGAKRVSIIEEPMAAAIGAGLPVAEPTGSMIVDIGGTSEVAVISLGGIVTSRSVRVAGDEFDSSIINYIKKKYNLLIGERTAENIKIAIGSAYPYADNEPSMDIKGRNLLNGLPENITVTSEEIREALSEPLSHVIEAIKVTLEKTPPELAADIIDQGIMLAGGGALLKGLDLLIHAETGMPVKVAERPLDCVADGTGKVLENIDKLIDVLTDDDTRY